MGAAFYISKFDASQLVEVVHDLESLLQLQFDGEEMTWSIAGFLVGCVERVAAEYAYVPTVDLAKIRADYGF